MFAAVRQEWDEVKKRGQSPSLASSIKKDGGPEARRPEGGRSEGGLQAAFFATAA